MTIFSKDGGQENIRDSFLKREIKACFLLDLRAEDRVIVWWQVCSEKEKTPRFRNMSLKRDSLTYLVVCTWIWIPFGLKIDLREIQIITPEALPPMTEGCGQWPMGWLRPNHNGTLSSHWAAQLLGGPNSCLSRSRVELAVQGGLLSPASRQQG